MNVVSEAWLANYYVRIKGSNLLLLVCHMFVLLFSSKVALCWFCYIQTQHLSLLMTLPYKLKSLLLFIFFPALQFVFYMRDIFLKQKLGVKGRLKSFTLFLCVCECVRLRVYMSRYLPLNTNIIWNKLQ